MTTLNTWTPIKPKTDGFFWFHQGDYPPWIIEIRDGELYENGQLIDYSLSGAKYYGPIEPPTGEQDKEQAL